MSHANEGLIRAAMDVKWEIYKHFQTRPTSEPSLHPLVKVLQWKQTLRKALEEGTVSVFQLTGHSDAIDEITEAEKDLDEKINEIITAARVFDLNSDCSIIGKARVIAWLNHFDEGDE